MSGVTAQLNVNGNLLATYSWHDVNGVALTLNYGQIGLGSNNAKTLFNNVVVSVPVAAPTWSYQTSFYNQPTYLDAPTSGTWVSSRSGYTATAPVGGFGLAPIDLALAIGVAPGTFTLQPSSTIDISATLCQIGGSAGVTFDNVNGGFKFAAIMASAPSGLTYAAGLTAMKTGGQYVVLGHYTPGSGFVIDAGRDDITSDSTHFTFGAKVLATGDNFYFSDATTLTNDGTIQGGYYGVGTLNNNGMIDGSGLLYIGSHGDTGNGLVNHGMIEANDRAGLEILAFGITNDGTILVGSGSSLELATTAGFTPGADGVVDLAGALAFQGNFNHRLVGVGAGALSPSLHGVGGRHRHRRHADE